MSVPIFGHGGASAGAIQAWFVDRGPDYKGYAPDKTYKAPPDDLGQAIVDECRRYIDYVVNHDYVAAQILHETAAWQSKYARERNNPGGIGAVNHDPDQAHWFPTVAAGVRAHVAHLLTYVLGDGPWTKDTPRYEAVKARGWLGSVVFWPDLNGKWAYPGATYGQSIITLGNQLRAFASGFEEPMTAQIPGFTWEPAELDHYHGGRTARIRGGAQHYTAGTNSLPWLTKTSHPPVSATFLVRNKPTMEDRGWQLVRIEDTAWTTAFANDYTVSVEYEHNGHDPIPDVAYTVLAQTWIDIAAYVAAHDLGSIPLNRNGIRGHKEWVGNATLTCPDGIDINRIVAEIDRLLNVKPPEDALFIAGNPFGEIPIVAGFKGLFLDTGKVKYPDDPIAGAVSLYGYPEGPEYPTSFGSAQVFERAIFKWHRGAQRPWDVVVAHRMEPVPEAA